ncbi:MAG: flippase [Acidobacteria bacterium]|nr:flippase [Acidobacteriota bacterium]
MTPDPNQDTPDPLLQVPPSAAGLTTKVVKGSIWTFGGQILPMAVSFVATPITIRLMSREEFGIFSLLLILPNFLLFADAGMSLASTKFASEAYANNDRKTEANIVFTAFVIGLFSIVPIAATVFLAAPKIVGLLGVPSSLYSDSVLATRITAGTILLNLFCTIVNTPELARLRMDINTGINTFSRILGVLLVPLAVYFGMGLVGAASVLFLSAVVNLVGHVLAALHLLPELRRSSFDRSGMRSLLRFGLPLVVGVTAGAFLGNVDRTIVSNLASVEAVAYYGVAFTFVSLVTLFSGAMVQSLIPAFSQLGGTSSAKAAQRLYTHSLRLVFVALLPALVILLIGARPFFALWAGEDFARESTPILYMSLAGLLFTVPAYPPYAAVVANGGTGMMARLFLFETVPYLALAALLTYRLGAKGAALAWSCRMVFEAVIWFSNADRRYKLDVGRAGLGGIFAAASVLFLPIFAWAFSGKMLPVSLLLLISLVVYALLLWKKVLWLEEKDWISHSLWRFTRWR